MYMVIDAAAFRGDLTGRPEMKQTLDHAIKMARTPVAPALRRAAVALDGCPVGGWPETQQAMRAIVQELPLAAEREYTLAQFVDAAYEVDHANRYRAKLWLEQERANEARQQAARSRALAIPVIHLAAPAAPNKYSGELQARSVSVYVDGEGYVCTSGGTWDEIAAAVPAEWLARARAARAEIVAAG